MNSFIIVFKYCAKFEKPSRWIPSNDFSSRKSSKIHKCFSIKWVPLTLDLAAGSIIIKSLWKAETGGDEAQKYPKLKWRSFVVIIWGGSAWFISAVSWVIQWPHPARDRLLSLKGGTAEGLEGIEQRWWCEDIGVVWGRGPCSGECEGIEEVCGCGRVRKEVFCNAPQGLIPLAAPPAIRLTLPSWSLHQITYPLTLSFHLASYPSIYPRLSPWLPSPFPFVSTLTSTYTYHNYFFCPLDLFFLAHGHWINYSIA